MAPTGEKKKLRHTCGWRLRSQLRELRPLPRPVPGRRTRCLRPFVAGEPGCRRQALVSWVLFKGAHIGSVTRWPLLAPTGPYGPLRAPTGKNRSKTWVLRGFADVKPFWCFFFFLLIFDFRFFLGRVNPHLKKNAHFLNIIDATLEIITPPEATNTGPGFKRGTGGGARGCGFDKRVGAYARTEGRVAD